MAVPDIVGADAHVHESYDAGADCFRIRVEVVNRRFGPLLGYEGSFTAEYVDIAEHGIPDGLRPVREDARA